MPFPGGEKFREKKGQGGVGIDLIEGCNIRCRQCFYEKGVAPFKMMTLEQVRFIIDKVVANGKLKEFYILGGEPTLHPHLPEIIAAALPHFKTVVLVTNGIRLADAKYCQSLAQKKLTISMHKKAVRKSARELVDYLAQKKGAAVLNERAWRNIGKYWKGPVCVQCNLLKPLVEGGHIYDVFKWARERNYNPVMELTKPGPIFERGHELDVTVEEVEALYAKMLRYDRRCHPKKHRKLKVLTPPAYGSNCTMVETGIHILNDGTVIPCIAHGTLPLGNVFQDDLDQILNSKIRLAIQDYANWIVGPCRNCKHFEYCHAGCRGEAFWNTGCPRSSDPYCWHHPKGLNLGDMVPDNCEGCILEDHAGCRIKVR